MLRADLCIVGVLLLVYFIVNIVSLFILFLSIYFLNQVKNGIWLDRDWHICLT